MNDVTNINANRAQLNSGQTGAAKSRNEAKQENQPGNSSATSADRVTLTDTASKLKDIEQQVNSASVVDNARVAEVQSAITNGEYTVNADRIADKMLTLEDAMSS